MGFVQFGKAPAGDRLARILKSPQYRNGSFQNISITPELAEGHRMTSVLKDFLFKNRSLRKPKGAIPSVQTDLGILPEDEDVLVWFGHSSYFMQLGGVKFLMDPVFSGNASPLRGTNKAFAGADLYKPQDMPEIDYLVITHDHYDHLDYVTIVALRSKVKQVICPLGVGAHFEYWGYDAAVITELDWYEAKDLQQGFHITATPARHFSGRGMKRNNTLWCSYVLQTPAVKIFIGGDSGYDTHFAEIGKRFGPFDLAILENGQYNEAWAYIHTLPEQLMQVAQDLQTKSILPVHSSKFMLANHPWKEPLQKIVANNETFGFGLLTPLIGELVRINDGQQVFDNWWEGVL